MRGVGDIDDRGAGGRAHVPDESGGAGNDDLAATRAIKISDLTQTLRGTHGRLVPMRRHHGTKIAAEKGLPQSGAPATRFNRKDGPAIRQVDVRYCGAELTWVSDVGFRAASKRT